MPEKDVFGNYDVKGGDSPPLAHSAKPGIPAQTYPDHIDQTVELAISKSKKATSHDSNLQKSAVSVSTTSASLHDIGKLAEANQKALRENNLSVLPINHTDAGMKIAYELYKTELLIWLVGGHHGQAQDKQNGFPRAYREHSILHGPDYKKFTVRDTDQNWKKYIEEHNKWVKYKLPTSVILPTGVYMPLFWRIMLAILADSDRQNTSIHSDHVQPVPEIDLKPGERIEALDRYMLDFPVSRRNSYRLRRDFYESARNHWAIRKYNDLGVWFCDAVVGSGKTFFTLRCALDLARINNLNRVFYISLYTSVLEQNIAGNNDPNAKSIRQALVLPGEDPLQVTAMHHHRVKHEDGWFSKQSYHLASKMWNPAVIGTTGVQFFETLMSCNSTKLMKLHHLARSVIIIDEIDNMLPVRLWPLALRMLKALVRDWGCKLIFSSGTIEKFWKIDEVNPEIRLAAPRPGQRFESLKASIALPEWKHIPNLVKRDIRKKMIRHEKKRVNRRFQLGPKTREDFVDFVLKKSQPTIIVVNTVQIAAVLTRMFSQRIGEQLVYHLSTALAMVDRRIVDKVVREKLTNRENFILVATSMVECGKNYCFRNGFRQDCRYRSGEQTGGRIRREEVWSYSSLWSFDLIRDHYINFHPDFCQTAEIAREMYSEGKFGPEYCDEAFRREITGFNWGKDKHGGLSAHGLLIEDNKQHFKTVDKNFSVIAADTKTCIVNPQIAQLVREGIPVSFEDITNNSVQIYSRNIEKFGCEPLSPSTFSHHDHPREIYEWTLGYDEKYGYMAGVLPLLDGIVGQGGFANMIDGYETIVVGNPSS